MSPAGETPRRSTIALVDIYNGGNLGDQAVQEATLAYYADRDPPIDVVLFTTWPRMTEAIHGVPSHMLSPGVGGVHYALDTDPRSPLAGHGSRSRAAPPDGRSLDAAAGLEGGGEARGWWGRLKGVMRRAPGVYEFLRGLRYGLVRLFREIGHTWDTLRTLRRVDAVFVNGGGQINDEWGGPTAHPFTLAKFSALCLVTRTPLAVVSVGASELISPWSERFIGLMLRVATYASVRDEDSRRVLAARFDTRKVACEPDLAFAFEPRSAVAGDSKVVAGHLRENRSDPMDGSRPHGVRGPESGAGTVIAFSPISYRKPGVWSWSDESGFQAYRERMVRFLSDQLVGGRRLRFFATSPLEWELVDDLIEAVSDCRSEAVESLLPEGYLDGMSRFVEAVTEADLVVASRLHGVALAHALGVPAVAISHDRKVDAHMETMGAVDRLIGIEDAEPDRISALVERTLANRVEITASIRSVVADRRARVEEQYEMLARRLGLGH